MLAQTTNKASLQRVHRERSDYRHREGRPYRTNHPLGRDDIVKQQKSIISMTVTLCGGVVPTVHEVRWKFFLYFFFFFFADSEMHRGRRRKAAFCAFYCAERVDSLISYYLHISIYRKQHMQEQCKRARSRSTA